ncbi:unnamed protein product [Boreogadus saida]
MGVLTTRRSSFGPSPPVSQQNPPASRRLTHPTRHPPQFCRRVGYSVDQRDDTTLRPCAMPEGSRGSFHEAPMDEGRKSLI